MLRKVFKTILIFSICIGITIPTNAGSVSLSDGSAFVTKSELSYELNNLSNRMSQLENSLDSKIDSLVSSYLTRNGIWNGEEVNIDKTEARLVDTDFQSSWNSWQTIEKIVWGKSAIANKSGMIVCGIHIEGKQGTATQNVYRCYLRIIGGNFAGFEDDARVSLRLTEKVNGVAQTRSRLEIANSQQRTLHNNTKGDGIDSSTHILPLPLNNDYVLLGFVSKDNDISIEMIHNVADFQSGNSSSSAAGIKDGAYLFTRITSCSIY